MKQVQAGETGQLAVLFERHHESLFRYLTRLTGNRTLSEDLVQEVFFRVLKYAPSYKFGLSFQVWLYGMARNAYFDIYRKRRREVPIPPLNEIKSTEPMLEQVMSRQEDIELLEEALRQLPEAQREVIVLSRYQNLRYDDIARILECELGAVKVRVYRALKLLREKFRELSGEKAYDA